jgi:diguanylate cyclase (GGDEF)-like protein/PAS domain S-box-containing protein
MKNPDKFAGKAPPLAKIEQALRLEAEVIARNKTASWSKNNEVMTPEKVRQMLYELQVHQIELELQNEELRQAQIELGIARTRYFDLYNLAPVGYCSLNDQGLILDGNLTAAILLDTDRSALIKQAMSYFILQEDQHIYHLYRERLLVSDEQQVCELRMQKLNGAFFWAQLRTTVTRDADGVSVWRVVMIDITALKTQERALKNLAHYDALTSLPNRVLLADRLQSAMAQAQRCGHRLAVAYIDLDGFKAINDQHGQEAGDQLLIVVAARMKRALRTCDTLARIGGDEFVAVMVGFSDEASNEPMLTRLLTAASQPASIGNASDNLDSDLVIQISASLGVTFYPQADAVDADQLLRQADQAMYQAKLAGKNRYHVFDAEQDRSVRGHHESLAGIRRALTAREFVLYYQPKVNMRTGAIIGAEALIRWQHPEKGLLPPAVFLPVIEDHPLAIEVGEWVIDTALTQMEIWHADGLDIPVSVNIGARQLQQANFVERLRALLAAHPRIKPSSLELEVLETSALEDLAQVSKVISACREIGMMFALDDFGTGYSSLTYLKRLSVTQLKIDQSFVRDMLDDPDDLAILEGVLGLASAFRRQVIAEGVETIEHGTMLLRFGCELAQGYGIARPMPAGDLPAWCATWRPDSAWLTVSAVSRDDLPVLFACVEHRAWIAALETHLKGECAAPPPLDVQQSRLGMWLDTKRLTGHSAQAAMQAIEPLHQKIHALAAALLKLKAQGHKSQALARLGELQDLRDALITQMKALVQHSWL